MSKQLVSLWNLLSYISQQLPSHKSLRLLNDHRADLTKVKDMNNLHNVCLAMIESSKYSIAMCLYLSAFMRECGDNDLSRNEAFNIIADKYTKIALQLVASVESDHLLALLLETPTDLENMCCFEIALKYKIVEFLDNSRVGLLMVHMWSTFDFLNPNKNFRTKDIDLFELLTLLITQPSQFYYCPAGRYWTSRFMYL